MHNIREQAISMINEAPEDAVIYIIGWLMTHQQDEEHVQLKREAAWENLRKYHKSVHRDIDCKAELHQYWEERYASLN